MSAHEKIVILKRFQKARRKYLPVKYSYYEYVSAPYLLRAGSYELRIGDAYLFQDSDGTFGMAREKYHARTKGTYYPNVHTGRSYHSHGKTPLFIEDSEANCRWWFPDEDIPPLRFRMEIT